MMRSYFIYLTSRLSRMVYDMSDECIFCKIVSKQVKATIVYQDEQVTAFRDSRPVAPTHILLVPNKHIDSVGTLEVQDEQIIGHIFTVARRLAEQEGISNGGFRMITNTGSHGGQTVFHLHVHLIGGQRMRYPMG
jgi:histidine triad (HIT) family protein